MNTPVIVPTLGESVAEATVAKWLKKVGDPVSTDEVIVELETDKVSVEVTSPNSGYISEIKTEVGETVEVGSQLGSISQSQSKNTTNIEKEVVTRKAKKSEDIKPKRSEPANNNVVKLKTEVKKDELSPAVKRIVEERKIDLSQIQGSGKDGRILKSDLITLMGEKPVPTQRAETHGLEEKVKMTRLRATIAKRLKEAQNNAAILTTFNEVDMSMIIQLRKDNKEEFLKIYGVKLGFMSFFIKACVNALKTFPLVNAEVQNDEIIYKNYYNIGVAVGTDKGLVVPVVNNADQMSFADIEKNVLELGTKARDGQLTIDELQGGTFTITNGGIYGSMLSTPIINPPQSAVLGMHNIIERAVVIDGEILVRPIMYLALSYDHRIIDGKEAVSFLVRVKEILEDPRRLFLNL
jgi:2-oxoglutarate dehydrogenase E2 component (dihydrolipoamide succinyltransferase)